MTTISTDFIINTAESASSLKDIKTSMKELKDAMIRVSEDSPKEFNKLAKAAADLKDRVEDANERISALKPGGFEAINNFASKAASGISAMTGAMALFGGESEDVQKVMMKVQAAMALSQGLEGIKDMGKAWSALNTVMKENPILAVVAAMALLTAGAVALYNTFKKDSDELTKANKDLEANKKAVEELTATNQSHINLMKAELSQMEAQGISYDKILAQKKLIYEAQLKEIDSNIAVAKSAEIVDRIKIKEILANDSLTESVYRGIAASLRKLGLDEQAKVNDAIADKLKMDRAKEFADDFKKQNDTITNLTNEKQALILNYNTEQLTDAKKVSDASVKNSLDNIKAKQTEFEAIDNLRILQAQKDEDALSAKQKLIDDELEYYSLYYDKLSMTQAEFNLKVGQLEAERLKNQQDYDAKHLTDSVESQRKEAEAINDVLDQADEEAGIKSEQMILKKVSAWQRGYEMSVKFAKKMNETANAAMLSSTSDLLGSLSDLSKKHAKLSKGLAIGQATINTFEAATKALASLPTPANFIGAAAAIAAGLVQVRNIMAVDTNGNGGGSIGSGSMGGGSSSGINSINTAPQGVQPSTQLDENGNVVSQSSQPMPPQRVYVVESDITRTQRNVSVVESAMSFRG